MRVTLGFLNSGTLMLMKKDLIFMGLQMRSLKMFMAHENIKKGV